MNKNERKNERKKEDALTNANNTNIDRHTNRKNLTSMKQEENKAHVISRQ